MPLCEPKLACGVDQLYASWDPLAIGCVCLFFVIGVSPGINGVSRQLIPTGPRGRVAAEFNEPRQETESALPGPCRV